MGPLILVGVVASLVLLALCAVMALMSVHGPDALALLGPGYALLCQVILWTRARG